MSNHFAVNVETEVKSLSFEMENLQGIINDPKSSYGIKNLVKEDLTYAELAVEYWTAVLTG